VPRWADMRTFRGRTADVVSGGFPCQDVSVAGKRQGLAGSRSGLWWEFHRILAAIRPTWLVVENVPGLLSSNDGRDFAAILGGLGELGYSLVWRVLDAQWFGVAQRRRRVFIVGHLGNRSPHEVLDLGQGCTGDSPPSRQAGPAVAALTSCGLGGGGPDDNLAQAGHVLAYDAMNDQATEELVPTLGQNTGMATGRAGTILTSGVRRLTPVECARLQGFPDDWNDHLADTHRYRQYGNAVCVPVAEWVGRRIINQEEK
jgi:DNA (cytosine-5)-methyltransferase 1